MIGPAAMFTDSPTKEKATCSNLESLDDGG
jgi:hypothetical protein